MKSKRLPSLLCVAAATSVLALPATLAVTQTDSAEAAITAEALPNTWFVELKNAPAADGTYYAKISVLKALGDSGDPAHWETWNSPTFVIDRP